MTDLRPMVALGGTDPKQCQIGAVTLQEDLGLALASLSMAHGQKVPRPFGLTLPDVGKISASDGFFAVWVGVNKWMLARDGKAQYDLAADLGNTLPEYAGGGSNRRLRCDQCDRPERHA